MSQKRPRSNSSEDTPPRIVSIDRVDLGVSDEFMPPVPVDYDDSDDDSIGKSASRKQFNDDDDESVDGGNKEEAGENHSSDGEEENQPVPTDAWLDTVDEMSSAPASAELVRQRIDDRNRFWSDSEQVNKNSRIQVSIRKVISLLNAGETPRKAMDRCLGRSQAVKPKIGGIRARQKADVAAASSSVPQSTKDVVSFEALTEAVDELVSLGLVGVLDETRERLVVRLSC